jgi:acetyltransferase-like isoleucine patch superfamily enzyme
MNGLNRFMARVRRADTPLFRILRNTYRMLNSPPGLHFPRLLKPAGAALYQFHFGVVVFFRSLRIALYTHPLFQARCTSVGLNLRLDGKMPFVEGLADIHIGDDVSLGGGISISSGGVFEQPKLVIGNRSLMGWNCRIAVNKEVIIGEDVFISFDCHISDTDGHPRDAIRRARHEPPDARDIRPVKIERYAWIGNSAHILKGVTIGEGAIIGANSVVIHNIPAYTIAIGNPAEVIVRMKRPFP